jgi:hypothetical protein
VTVLVTVRVVEVLRQEVWLRPRWQRDLDLKEGVYEIFAVYSWMTSCWHICVMMRSVICYRHCHLLHVLLVAAWSN